jgi:GMP synthase-like glutamine amidotransferase
MKIGLLECDHVAERFHQIAGDYREMFAALLARVAPEWRLEPYDVCNGELPALTACDAYLTTGSRFSVYDDVVWIQALQAFVRELRAARKPFVGVCFGHQLLAEALGGKVAKAAQGWGVGAQTIELTQAEAWMQPPQTSCRLQYMHQDQVQQLPPRAVVLGRSAHCPVALFRVGETMLGIQAHPEFPASYSEALLIDRSERIGADVVARARATLTQPTDEAVVMSWVKTFIAKGHI